MAPTCIHPGYGPALLAHPSHNCTHSSKLTFPSWKACRTPLASFCRTRTLNGIWTIYARVRARGCKASSDCSRIYTDFLTGLKFPIVMHLGEPVSELPALCWTTRPKGSSGLTFVNSSHVRWHERGNAGTIVSTSSLDAPQDVLNGKRQCDIEMKLGFIAIRKLLTPRITKIRIKLSPTLLLWRLGHTHVDSCVITDTRSRKLFARVHVHNTGHSDPPYLNIWMIRKHECKSMRTNQHFFRKTLCAVAPQCNVRVHNAEHSAAQWSSGNLERSLSSTSSIRN